LKKANIYVWLIVLLTFPVISIAQTSDFSLYFYNSVKQRRFAQNTNYNISPFPDWQMQVNSRNLEEKRIDFNQISRNSGLEVSLSKNSSLISHEIQTGYDYLYDSSSLESELKPYRNKAGFLGYGIRLSPVDSLSIETSIKGFYRQEQDRYKANHKFFSRGLSEKAGTNYTLGNPTAFMQLSGNLENKNMDWENYQLFSAALATNVQADAFTFSCFINASSRMEDLFILANPDSINPDSRYEKYDRQRRKNLNANVALFLPASENLDCEVIETYTLSTLLNQENKTRNTGDYNNLAQFNLSYRLIDDVTLKSNNTHSYYIKDLSFISNTRIIDVRNSNSSFAWEYNPYDSLLFDYTIELRRTIYPDSEHKLDNDYLSNIYKLGWILFWKDRIRIANRLLYLQKEEVFLNESLSANNNTVTGLQWQPECDIFLGDSFLLHQDYQIRADYDDYYYNNFSEIKDTFYRQLTANYHILYDSTPLAAKINLPKWNFLPFRSRNTEAFRMDVGYSWERIETSTKEEDIYIVNGIEDKQTLSCLLQKQYGIVICQLYPKYSWGYWREYNCLLSAAWQLNKDSIAELSLNPIGPELNNLDWRISCSINLMF